MTQFFLWLTISFSREVFFSSFGSFNSQSGFFPQLLFLGVCLFVLFFFFPLCRVGCRDCWTGFSNQTAVVGRNYTSSEHIDVGDIVPRENKEADVQPKDRQRHTHAIHRVLWTDVFCPLISVTTNVVIVFLAGGSTFLLILFDVSKNLSKWTFIYN